MTVIKNRIPNATIVELGNQQMILFPENIGIELQIYLRKIHIEFAVHLKHPQIWVEIWKIINKKWINAFYKCVC